MPQARVTLANRKAHPTVESLTEVERSELAGCPLGTRLEVIVETTGPAWLPIAVFFITRGHVVFRVSSAKASGLVELQLRVSRSGPPRHYDLADRSDRARVYEQVLSEGTEDDVRLRSDRACGKNAE